MGEKTRVLSILVFCIMSFGEFALASPPVPPPEEGFVISTACDVEVKGDLLENEAYVWTYVSDAAVANTTAGALWETLGFPGSSVDPLYLGIGGSAAETRYSEELDSIDSSLTQFKKGLVAGSEESPNLAVNKDLGYVASAASLIAHAEDKERVGLSVVAYGNAPTATAIPAPMNEVNEELAFLQGGGGNGDGNLGGGGNGLIGDPPLQDIPSLCPWAGGEIPATNEFIAAGSDMSTTSAMVSHTEAAVTSTGPPSLNHGIDATGTGTVTALMKVQLMEGTDSVDFEYWNDMGNFAGRFVTPDLASETAYDEKTSASGTIEKFSKAMHYHSTIPSYQLPEPWYELQ
ncbi:MAG: hypothetical protein SWE60_06500 [Thermodesulfobacteriota bacterium]|nr:hypothetical protein [Thermodesulfobacteriota bacterium]